MNIRKSIFGLVLAVFVLALCTSGNVMAGQELTLTFQEKFNIITGEQDGSYTGTMDISLRKWDMPKNPPTEIGTRGQYKIRQYYFDALNRGHYPAGLLYFPDILSTINALPDDGDGPNAGVGPYIDSATLILTATAWSSNPNTDPEIINPVVAEISMVTPNATMWAEGETPVAIEGKTRPLTNAKYRWYDGTTGVEWVSPHLWEGRSPNPVQQGTAGDHGSLVDTYICNGNPWQGIETVELDVLPIINDWIDGTYENQGFHLDMGVSTWDGDYQMNLQIITKEGADGTWTENEPPRELLTDAPKLVITYSYNGNITADAGADMGDYYADAVTRVKRGVEVTLDGSASTPVFAGSPITQYKWSWNYGTNEYTILSPNDTCTAQFPITAPNYLMGPEDNVTLVASDDIGQTGTDGARVKVTPRIPGDLNGDGCVNLTDFVILRNDF